MLYRQTLRFAGAETLVTDYEQALERLGPALQTVRQERADARPYLSLPGRTDDLDEIRRRADALRAKGFTDIVVLGTGGSSLGAKALAALTGPHFAAPTVRLHVPDNLGAALMDALFEQLDLHKTHVIAVSKSGGTAETVAQLITAYQAVAEAVGADRAAHHFTLVTEPGDSLFRQLAARWQLSCYDHDPKLGGRYSVMSIVGLLPAALVGLDIAAVRRGAVQVLDQALGAERPADVPAAAGAAFGHVLATRHGCPIQVLMAYDQRLDFFTRWWAQLWAESLGKNGRGTTPVAALGPVDQHSQVQLYLDGPADKIFTILAPETKGLGPRIEPAHADDPKLDYLAGRHIGDLVDAEAAATAEALARRGRPVRQIHIEAVDALVIGGLMMHYMLETVLSAHLLGVDAFDQPAVEEGKVLTREALRGGALPEPDPATIVSGLKV
ncbi:MAG: glucose-6-phosphate isomerase [Rhodothalassiaceae bacterium]